MAENSRAVGSVTYREAGQEYFEKRSCAVTPPLVTVGTRRRRRHLR